MDIAYHLHDKKLKWGMFSNKETKGIFWYEIKIFEKEKSYHFLFQLKSIYKGQKFKIQILYNTYVLIFYCPNWIFGQDFLQAFLRPSVLKASEALHIGCIGNIT